MRGIQVGRTTRLEGVKIRGYKESLDGAGENIDAEVRGCVIINVMRMDCPPIGLGLEMQEKGVKILVEAESALAEARSSLGETETRVGIVVLGFDRGDLRTARSEKSKSGAAVEALMELHGEDDFWLSRRRERW